MGVIAYYNHSTALQATVPLPCSCEFSTCIAETPPTPTPQLEGPGHDVGLPLMEGSGIRSVSGKACKSQEEGRLRGMLWWESVIGVACKYTRP